MPAKGIKRTSGARTRSKSRATIITPSPTPSSGLKTSRPTSRNTSSPALQQQEIVVTPLDQLLSKRRPHQLAADLANSLVLLRARLAELELERTSSDGRALNPLITRRAQDRRMKLEHEIVKTERMQQRLLTMTRVVDGVVGFRETVLVETRTTLEKEAGELKMRIETNDELIREEFVRRVNLLHRYWLWRTLQELGDVTVGSTFEEELARGPRYRTVGLQNSILSDTLHQQLIWLQRFAEREESFREQVRRLDHLVEELTDINEVLEEALRCRVCGLLFEDPVICWPCGHTFCLVCFDSISIAPSLFRCPTCGSIGSEGYVHNLLTAESVAKWMFKEAGYGDIHGALSLIRLHLSKFRKDAITSRIGELKARLKVVCEKEAQPENDRTMSIIFRAY